MNEILKLEELKNDWYGRLEDLTEEIEERNFEIYEATTEYISCASKETDAEYIIRLGGTERTITIESIREI